MVDQSSLLTAGTKAGSREKSLLSWRAAVVIMVQNSKGEALYISSGDVDSRRIGNQGW